MPLMLAGPVAGWAGDWRIVPRLDIAGVYTDNVALAPPGSEEHEFITQVTPGVLIERESRRLHTGLDYQLENLFFTRESDRDTRFHRFDGRARAVVLSDLLFLDATAGHIQRVISTADAIPIDNLTISDNRTDTTSYSVSPYLFKRTDEGWETLLRYEFNSVEYDNAAISDVRTRRAYGRIGQLDGVHSWGWQLGHTHVEHDAETGLDSTLRRSELELRYHATGRLQLLAIGGYEDNEYDGPTDADLPRGGFWSAGFVWSPSVRTLLRVTAGRRFFGETAAVSLTHRTRQAEWEVAYTEELETGSDLLVQSQAGTDIGAPVAAPEGSELTSEIYLRKRASLERSRSVGKSDVTLGIFDERREYLVTQEHERNSGIHAAWRWRFATRTSALVSGDVQRFTLRGTDREDELRMAALGLQRQVTQDSLVTVEYRYYERDSDDTESAYRQNMVSLRAQITF